MRDAGCAWAVEKSAVAARTVSNLNIEAVIVHPDVIPPFARSGMTVYLEFVIEEKKGALDVPSSAIQQKAGGSKEGSKSGARQGVRLIQIAVRG